MDQLGLVPVLEVNGLSSSHWGETSINVPQAMEGLQGMSPPPFLGKIWDLVDDSDTNHIVSWSKDNNSFVVWDPDALALQVLPKYFKHCKLSSFIRQLNTYGFRKVDPDKLEFASEWFLRGQRHLLKQVKRRKPPSQPHYPLQGPSDSCIEVVQCGSEVGTDRSKIDKKVLRVELVRLEQEQRNTKAHLREIKCRLKEAEIKQQHIMGFLARMIQNPRLIPKFLKSGRRDHELVETISKKRSGEFRRQFYAESGTKDFGDIKVPVIKTLSMGMQDLEETYEESQQRCDGENKGLDQQFWQELLNNRAKEESGSGFNDSLTTAYPTQTQYGDSNSHAQYSRASFVLQDQQTNNSHQMQSHRYDNGAGLALGPPESSSSFQTLNTSVQQSSLNPFDWSQNRDTGVKDFLSEEEIRARSHEMLENEDMQHLLRLFSMQGHSSITGPDDSFSFPSFAPSPLPNFSFDEERNRPGKAVVGWLKIKAAMRWGFFIRKKAAETDFWLCFF